MGSKRILPFQLHAPEPGWTESADLVIVGSGIAGLSLALQARTKGLRQVVIVTKSNLRDGSTNWAQGGIAAALGSGDTPERHYQDTVVAGDGLCDTAAVRVLVEEGPGAVIRLLHIGTQFDRDEFGQLQLTREGGHDGFRIVHARGDATGAEVMRALEKAVRSDPGIKIYEHAMAVDVLLDAENRACGVTLHVIGEGQRDGVGMLLARAVVLATGGAGQLFAQTTNPSVATGDGMALGLRAGAALADMEFIQFHPTVMYLANGKGQQPLISEAVRGEGAFLLDRAGKRFMTSIHEMAELAPRDVVAKAIMTQMMADHQPCVRLDARHFGAEKWQTRFPGILESCRRHRIDPVKDLIPVAPAAHYISGGVRTNLFGETNVPGLYACGETACTGVHGANRLASNSLLEGLVFAERIAQKLAEGLSTPGKPVPRLARFLPTSSERSKISMIMTRNVGVLRNNTSLVRACFELGMLSQNIEYSQGEPSVECWETRNLLDLALIVVGAALDRVETRGGHWREDFPARDDARWQVRQIRRYEGQIMRLEEEVVR